MEKSILEKTNTASLFLLNDQVKLAVEILESITESDATYDSLTFKGIAYQRLNDYDTALKNFNFAIGKDANRYEAYYNSGKTCFFKGNHAEAGAWFDKAKNTSSGNEHIQKQLQVWNSKIQAEISQKTTPQLDKKPQETASMQSQQQSSAQQTTASNTTSAPQQKTVSKPVGKIKYNWSQTDSRVYVDILFSLPNKDQFKIKIAPRKLDLSFPIDGSRNYEMDLDLNQEVDAEASSYKIHLEKVEVVLQKKVRGANWPSLETAHTDNEVVSESQTPRPLDLNDNSNTPFYPSSAKVKRDWNKIDREIEEDMQKNKGATP